MLTTMATLYEIKENGVVIGTLFVSEESDGPKQALHATHTLTDISPPHMKTPVKPPPAAPPV